MFAALPMLRAKGIGERPGLRRIPGGRIGIALVTGLGVSSTLLSIVFALIPPAGGADRTFYAKELGGCAIFLVTGLLLYLSGKRSSAPTPAQSLVAR
jgi:hypothetical protein